MKQLLLSLLIFAFSIPLFGQTNNAYIIRVNTSNDETQVVGDEIGFTPYVGHKGSNGQTYSVKVYISRDSIPDSNDIIGAEYTTEPINNNNYDTETVRIRDESLTGAYYYIVVADPEDSVSETDETDNSMYLYFNFLPEDYDLKADSTTVSTSYHSVGAPVTAYTYFSNAGTTMPSDTNDQKFAIGYYFSEDDNFSQDDVLAIEQGGVNIPDFDAEKSSSSYSTKPVIPQQFAGDDHVYLLTVVDHLNEHPLDDESNDVSSIRLDLTEPIAEVNISLPSSHAGRVITSTSSVYSRTVTAYNYGTDSANVKLDSYLSTDD